MKEALNIFPSTELADYYKKLQRAIEIYKENNESFVLCKESVNYHRKIKNLRMLKAHVLATTVNQLVRDGVVSE